MKPIHLILILSLILTAAFSCASAQSTSGTGEITGLIADSLTKKPVDYVTITLIGANNTSGKATYTRQDGIFRLTHIPVGKYKLGVAFIGYEPKQIQVNLTGSGSFNAGTIYLRQQQKQLKEVTVQSTKPLIKQEADRITYDLQADPESKGSSVFDMLRKVPYLSVDVNENILLKGKSDYKIFINGKPSGMVDNNPKNILKSMPASTIQKIEVITNPSSKYDAEGYAGIINIITTKTMTNGYNGSANINGNFPVGGPGAGGSLNAKLGTFGIAAYGGGNIYNAPQTSFSNSRVTTGAEPTSLNQYGLNEPDSHSGYFGTELSYEIDSLNLLSAQFNSYGSASSGNRTQSSLLQSGNSIIQGYDLMNSANNNNSGLDAAINYQLGFKSNKTRLLTFSYRYYKSTNTSYNNNDIVSRVQFTEPSYQQNNKGTTDEQTVQIDYVHPLKKVIIESGLKAISRHNNSNYDYLTLTNGVYIPDDNMSDNYENKQIILAAYNNYRFSLKKWDFSGGLRLEHTNTDINFLSTSSTVNQDYFNLVPSLSVNHNFKNQNSLNIGFSQRIQRPGINRLNPFVNRANPDYVISGNPNLRSSAINNVQVSYNASHKLSYNVGFTYTFLRDLALQISNYDEVSRITYTSYENIGKGNAYNVNFNMSYPLTKALNLSMNGNAIYIQMEGISNGEMISTGKFSENFYISAAYKWNNGWRLNTNFSYSGRNQVNLQQVVNPAFGTSVAINKDIIKNKLSFSASVNNPFTKFRNNITETTSADFIQTDVRQDYFRSFKLSLNYNFGKLKEAIKKNKRGIKNDDLSN
ncbi:TonB-dependent receptor [Mucilaginibacter sp. Bleaf8]|uniref:TonB-dependent receptor domain-containing protein n=1 Tax=Mucilaginibacter sp. Bleaf8 TaxID=2834430 RepID=UPI001BCB9FAA|nr:outer membrane beta-barrel family protein [Mucilaginibacter sp. Bleaf8]MBS7565965.1 TonB-dependent receptor [Mucilaginibacter sp. Bleaf8]